MPHAALFFLKRGRMIQVIKDSKEMQAHSEKIRLAGKRISLVPTMGFLHEGHLSLIREGRRHGDEVVVSIFVNPAQFGPGEDYEAYPRSFEHDCSRVDQAGASVVFGPNAGDLYGENYQTYVTLERLPQHLCGLSRPTHFRGVATVVSKLFNIVKPHAAVFGQKDFQQLLVIRRMVKDLNFDVEIIGAPIVREHDGLAMSSRNTYLTDNQRHQAVCLHNALKKASQMVRDGITDARILIESARQLIRSQPDAVIDYIAVCDPDTLEEMSVVDRPALMALAVKVGMPRLIDNMILEP
jgi:pantoate--beta-alanine ligase